VQYLLDGGGTSHKPTLSEDNDYVIIIMKEKKKRERERERGSSQRGGCGDSNDKQEHINK
jgi:hypothetical protein